MWFGHGKNLRASVSGQCSKRGDRELSAPQLLITVWTLLAIGPWLTAPLGHGSATLVIFSLCTGITLCAQPSFPSGTWRSIIGRGSPRPGVLFWGFAAGWGLAPGLGFCILTLGTLLGLEPFEPLPSNWSSRIGTLLLAPIFEEILYRERLSSWLRPRTGPLATSLISSLAFAVPHPGPWSQLTTFVIGLGLAHVRRASGSLGLCVALHSGLNLASEFALSGAIDWLLSPTFSLGLGLPATGALVARSRAGRRDATR